MKHNFPLVPRPSKLKTHPSKLPIAPLVTFRILFGAMMCIGAMRFVWKGWVERLYIEPTFFFKYYGFEWVQPLNEIGMYIVFGFIIGSAFCIMVGLFYRIAAVIFFLTFTYVEMIDATNYLNHYYLVCLLALLLIFLPVHRAFSLDAKRLPKIKTYRVPAWTIYILIFQLTLVYTYAGIAKLQSDWLLRAMPLAIWLPERANIPILGYFFQMEWVAFAFCWFGAIYDLTIAWFLMFRKTRTWAYLAVLAFHLMTWRLFNIGLFPIIMITSTLIFFSADFHKKLLGKIGYREEISTNNYHFKNFKYLRPFLIVYVILQMLLPLHHHLYKGKVLWTEEGYRLSWRVMAVEKSGQATFTIKDGATNRKSEVINGDYLTDFQEKQMSIQPDFILQFAHFLKKEYETQYGFENPIITADVFVALNGRTSKRLIDPTVNLAEEKFDLWQRDWIIRY